MLRGVNANSAHPSVREGVELSCAKPFQGALLRTTRSHGEVAYVVVVKLTFQLRPGVCSVVDEGEPVRADDEHWDRDPRKSVRYPADLVPAKGASEVIVVGHAHIAGGVTASSLIVRVIVGSVDKCLEAFSPRRMARDGQIEELYALSSIPLRYEYAAGGTDTDNPVGIDSSRRDGGGSAPLPALVPPMFELSRGSTIPTIGLGPIARTWPARARLLRPQDARWLDDTSSPLSAQFDNRFFNSAPSDQWLDQPIRPDERLILEGLDVVSARLVTNLPGIEPLVSCEPVEIEPPTMVADTLVVDSDRGLVTLTFRGQLELMPGSGPVRISVKGAKAGTPLAADPSQEPLERSPTLTISPAVDDTAVLSRTNMALDPAAYGKSPLPFAAGPAHKSSPGTAALPFHAQRSTAEVLPASPSRAYTSILDEDSVSVLQASAPPAPASVQGSSPPMVARPMPAPPAPAIAPVAPQIPVVPKVQLPPAPVVVQKPMMTLGAAMSGSSGKPSYLGKEEAAQVAAAPALAPARVVSAIAPSDLASAKALSDAAADRNDRKLKKVEAKVEVELRRRALVDLLTFDSGLPARLRRAPGHGELLAAAARTRGFRRLDETATQDRDKDALDVLRVLSLGAPVEQSSLRAAVETALDDVHDLDIPLLLVSGELRPTFDELETLRLSASVAQAFGSSDKRVQATIALVNEAVGSSAPPAGKAAQSLLQQLEQATAALSLPPRYIAETVERALLEQRKYRKRTLFGSVRVRADMTIGGSSYPIYLADDVSPKLPLLTSFAVLALVEVRPREDAAESQTDALLAHALGRLVRTAR